MNRKAVIDLGTNTFNLLIADVTNKGFQVVHSEKEGVALGMGGINQNIIVPEATERAIQSLQRFSETCKKFKVDRLVAIGTSAIRGANNATKFINEVRQKTGLEIQVISGEREAELIYHGVKWSFPFREASTVMDIGGGSTEFVFADNEGIRDLISLDIGVSRIFQKYTYADPMSDEDISRIEAWLEKQTKGYFDNKKEQILVGASGSFETFYELINNCSFPCQQNAVELPVPFLRSELNKIISSTQSDRELNPWIIPIRKKMAPFAAVKTRWILDKLKVERVFVSPYSLKEGALTI